MMNTDELSVALSYFSIPSFHPRPSSETKKTIRSTQRVVKNQNHTQGNVVVPRLPIKSLRFALARHEESFVRLIKRHGFVILTDIGAVEGKYNALMSEFKQFMVNSDQETKERQKGHIYFNERGIPMWQTGYEKMAMREAFRTHVPTLDRQPWPSESMQRAWSGLTQCLVKIADRCLALTLGDEALSAKDVGEKEDFSVCYALHYPNDDSYLEDYAVTEHIDPSLFVIEPCSNVDGLEVLDQDSNTWVEVEDLCIPGKELVVFTGKALCDATEGEIPGTLHRVKRSKHEVSRFCFIFEQKYSQYYPAPLD